MKAALSLLLACAPALALDVQGHRGARGHLPENTLPAFRYALQLGVDTLELDVGVTRDGVVVVHHDRRLNADIARGPDGRWISSPQTIASLSYDELQRYDLGRLRPGSEYAKRLPLQKPVDGARAPRLAEVLALGAPVNVETKVSPQSPDETLAPEASSATIPIG